jgi:hypothetical protein
MIPITITTCGRSEYFAATLASLKEHTPADVPISVFDDAVETLGRPAALAEAWRRSFVDPSIEAAIFVEDDVLFTIGWYEALTRWADHPNLGVVAGFEVGRSGDGLSSPSPLVPRPFVCNVCTFVTRSLWEAYLRGSASRAIAANMPSRDRLLNTVVEYANLGRYATCPHVAQHVGVISSWQRARPANYWSRQLYSRDLLHLVPKEEGPLAREATHRP